MDDRDRGTHPDPQDPQERDLREVRRRHPGNVPNSLTAWICPKAQAPIADHLNAEKIRTNRPMRHWTAVGTDAECHPQRRSPPRPGLAWAHPAAAPKRRG